MARNFSIAGEIMSTSLSEHIKSATDRAMNLARLLAEAEKQIEAGETRPAREFLGELKQARKAAHVG